MAAPRTPPSPAEPESKGTGGLRCAPGPGAEARSRNHRGEEGAAAALAGVPIPLFKLDKLGGSFPACPHLPHPRTPWGTPSQALREETALSPPPSSTLSGPALWPKAGPGMGAEGHRPILVCSGPGDAGTGGRGELCHQAGAGGGAAAVQLGRGGPAESTEHYPPAAGAAGTRRVGGVAGEATPTALPRGLRGSGEPCLSLWSSCSLEGVGDPEAAKSPLIPSKCTALDS